MKTTEAYAPRPLRAWMLVALLTAGLLALLPTLWKRGVALLIDGERQRTSEIPDATLPNHFRGLSAFGTPGMEAIADGLASDRPAVVAAARAALLDMLAECELLPAGEADERTLALAEWLSLRVDQLPTAGRAAASDLAVRVSAGPTMRNSQRRVQLAAACERVLQATAKLRPDTLRTLSATTARAVAAGPRESPTAPAKSNTAVAVVAAPDVKPVGHADENMDHSANAPVDPTQPPSDSPVVEPGRLELGQEVVRPLPPPNGESSGDTIIDPAVIPATAESPVPPDWQRMPWEELLRLLATENAEQVSAAQVELARRGFTASEIELGRRLADTDPVVRLRWTEAIPNLLDINAARWLEWLAGDDAVEVRRAAITLVATSGDDRLIDRVVRKAAQDAEPRIRRLAEQIAADRAALRRQPESDDRDEP